MRHTDEASRAPDRWPGPDAERLRVVAHELRSPVAALAALASAAPGVPPAERGRLVELAVAAGRDVERILSDPDLLSLRPERVDVARLVRGLAADHVAVSVVGSPEAYADPVRVRQALANLVSNGLRHGTQVRIEAREVEAGVALEVSDDGPGIDPAAEPFARGVSGVGSSGIGLWLARAIAEAHGGTLELVPHAGRGARLRLCLPSASAAR